MKKQILPSIILSLLCLILFSGIYPALIWVIAQCTPGKGEGTKLTANGKQYYENIAQKFTSDKYFWSRPSAVDYNAAGSGGSNKGPSNPEYLATVQARIDSFLAHDPGVQKAEIPSEMVTASGSGLDPDISRDGAKVQADRVAQARGLSRADVEKIINDNIQKPLWGMFGPEKINVLKLNADLDALKK